LKKRAEIAQKRGYGIFILQGGMRLCEIQVMAKVCRSMRFHGRLDGLPLSTFLTVNIPPQSFVVGKLKSIIDYSKDGVLIGDCFFRNQKIIGSIKFF
jgi:hypothetical protein